MSAYDGVCSPVYVVLTIREDVALPRFALRVFENQAFQRYIASFGNGILEHRAAIGWDEIKGTQIVIPPIKEQLQLLTFLDRETAKIDELMEEQRRLIELLKESVRRSLPRRHQRPEPRCPHEGFRYRMVGRGPRALEGEADQVRYSQT
jgi:hypothetical protein